MIWPFRRQKKQPREPSWKEQLVAELRAWRPIGTSFPYLGRECVVTSYWHLEGWGEFGPRSVVELRAEYADDLGVIRQASFSPAEARALMAKYPSAGAAA